MKDTIEHTQMSQIAYARLAGFMFLFVLITYITGFRLASLYGEGTLYRAALSSQLIANLCTILLAMGLYVALKPINADLALLALLFRVVEACGGLRLVSAFDASQITPKIPAPPIVHSTAADVPALFFSAGSLIFFYLFLKSRYIPRMLSMLGIVASVSYGIVSLGLLIWPEQIRILWLGWLPMLVAEVWTGVLLLWKGVNVHSARAGSPAY